MNTDDGSLHATNPSRPDWWGTIPTIRQTVETVIGERSAEVGLLIDDLVGALEEREHTIARALYAIGKKYGIDGPLLGQAFSDSRLDQIARQTRPTRALARADLQECSKPPRRDAEN